MAAAAACGEALPDCSTVTVTFEFQIWRQITKFKNQYLARRGAGELRESVVVEDERGRRGALQKNDGSLIMNRSSLHRKLPFSYYGHLSVNLIMIIQVKHE